MQPTSNVILVAGALALGGMLGMRAIPASAQAVAGQATPNRGVDPSTASLPNGINGGAYPTANSHTTTPSYPANGGPYHPPRPTPTVAYPIPLRPHPRMSAPGPTRPAPPTWAPQPARMGAASSRTPFVPAIRVLPPAPSAPEALRPAPSLPRTPSPRPLPRNPRPSGGSSRSSRAKTPMINPRTSPSTSIIALDAPIFRDRNPGWDLISGG